ncbi:MAG TPA: Crp/Fnr family transcriptional regulator [Candidatus Elarobacter sp.]|jgi:CRP-like cAMP-binding protein|nr:Crp/Fnr family transcriptional regulator [Candidatus Elarobacter sp.]
MLAGTAEKNKFLSALPPATRAAFEVRMTCHGGGIGDVLHAPDAPIEAVWFPLSGIVSTLRPLDGDVNVEVDASGAEGFLGAELLLGARWTPDTWVVQSPGRFARLDAPVFIDALDRDPSLREATSRYLAAVGAVRGQWIACNARHTIEQRLAKWLLTTRDRVGDEVQITQDVIAMMLGVRRASVVSALGRLVDDGMVSHGYARVRIVDAVRLSGVSCACYAKAAELLRAGLVAA